MGTQIGVVSHNIADDLSRYTYSLVHDGTPDDNLSFNLVDNNILMTNSVFDYEAKQTYTARIRAVRNDGFHFTSSVTITVTDVEESVFHFVPVGNPGNAADPATGSLYGDVNYEYSIGQYEITIGQYTEFLNAVAASDPYGLYNSSMASDALWLVSIEPAPKVVILTRRWRLLETPPQEPNQLRIGQSRMSTGMTQHGLPTGCTMGVTG